MTRARAQAGREEGTVPFRSVTHEGITLLCFPPYDTVFTRVAMDQLAALAASGRPTPPALEAALRSRFPRTTVRPRSSLAALLPGEAWYVYRDGRYSPFPDGDPWWERPGTAWIEIDDAGRYCDANEAALALIGADRDVLATLSTGDLADPAVRGLVPWVWELARAGEVLQSTSILRPLDRPGPVGIEYRLVRVAEGRWSVSMRVIPLEDARVALEAGQSADPVS
jgi:PAS domain-containing protein